MSAVRCLARRLAGSLLQRTQAVVAPSRFLCSRRLSTEVPSKPAAQTTSEQERTKLHELIKKYESFPKRERPDPSHLRVMSVIRASDDVINGAAKFSFFGLIAAFAFCDEEVEAQENQ